MEQGLRILIVDDSMLARMMMREAVEGAVPGAAIVEAKSGDEALQKLAREAVDFAFVDLNMPGMDGIELAQELRQRFTNIKLALCTANVQNRTRERAEEKAIPFIDKPISIDKVQSMMQAWS